MPSVRVTVRVSLSTLPMGMLILVAPPSMLPFVILNGSTISKGAPVSATALNCSTATFFSETVRGIGSTALPLRKRYSSAVRPLKIPSGRLLKSLSNSSSLPSEVSPLKTPEGRLLKLLLNNLSSVSAVRLLKIPSGRLLKRLLYMWSLSSAVRPLKTSSGRLLKSLRFR